MRDNLCLARVAGTLQRRWRGIWELIRGFCSIGVTVVSLCLPTISAWHGSQ